MLAPKILDWCWNARPCFTLPQRTLATLWVTEYGTSCKNPMCATVTVYNKTEDWRYCQDPIHLSPQPSPNVTPNSNPNGIASMDRTRHSRCTLCIHQPSGLFYMGLVLKSCWNPTISSQAGYLTYTSLARILCTLLFVSASVSQYAAFNISRCHCYPFSDFSSPSGRHRGYSRSSS